VNQDTLERFERARVIRDQAIGELQTAIENLINTSDLNDRRYVLVAVGSLAALQQARNKAWADYLKIEEQLIRQLNQGMFAGEHRSG
jgi:hypothetical protein